MSLYSTRCGCRSGAARLLELAACGDFDLSQGPVLRTSGCKVGESLAGGRVDVMRTCAFNGFHHLHALNNLAQRHNMLRGRMWQQALVPGRTRRGGRRATESELW